MKGLVFFVTVITMLLLSHRGYGEADLNHNGEDTLCHNCSVVVTLDKTYVEDLSFLVSIISAMPLQTDPVTLPTEGSGTLVEVIVGTYPGYALPNNIDSFDVARVIKAILSDKIQDWDVKSIKAIVAYFTPDDLISESDDALKNVGTIGHDNEGNLF